MADDIANAIKRGISEGVKEAIPPLTREEEAPVKPVKFTSGKNLPVKFTTRAKSKSAILIDEYLVQHPEALQQWKDETLSARAIALELGISHPTVNNYLKTLP